MSDDARADPGRPDLLAIYAAALAQSYGYLVRRFDSAATLPLLDLVTAPSGGITMTTRAHPIPAAVPYLAIGDGRAREAVAWYGRIFGATVNGDPYLDGDRISHAELQIGAGVLYICDEAPALGVVGPGDANDVSMMLPVADADAALAAGAHTNRESYDGYGQRNAWMVDPFGHRWGLNSPLRAR